MDETLLKLIGQISGNTTEIVKWYVTAYYAYWTASALCVSGTITGVAYMGYRLTKRWQDFEEFQWRHRNPPRD